MTELERILLDKLERIETAHQQQTAALELQLQQQARSLSSLQRQCSDALESCVTLCKNLQSEFETLQSDVDRSTSETSAALITLNRSVGGLQRALETLKQAQR